MNDGSSPACPHCGSHQLIAHRNSRRVYIDHAGESIPLLTVHFSLGHPVVETQVTTYTCACSWAGNHTELTH